MIFTTNEQVQSCIEKWQKILRLQDWSIQAKIVRISELANNMSQAEICKSHAHKAAILKVLDPVDYDNKYFAQDHELSIVHELIHIHVDESNTLTNEEFKEAAVCCITSGLIGLDRRDKS